MFEFQFLNNWHQVLLAAGGGCNTQNADGIAPLHAAAARGSAAIAGALLENGANPLCEAKRPGDAVGITPLAIAAEALNAEVVAVFLARPTLPAACFTARSGEGMTPAEVS